MFVEHPGANQLFNSWNGNRFLARRSQGHQTQNRDPTWVCHGAQREMLQWSGLEGIAGLISVKHWDHHFFGEKKNHDGAMVPWMVQSYQTKKRSKSPKVSKSLGSWSSESKSGRSPWPYKKPPFNRYRLWHIPCVLKNRCD